MAHRVRPTRPTKRYGYWYLARRVPKAYRHIDTRSVVFISSGIAIADDPLGTAAKDIIANLDAQLLTRWQRLANSELAPDKYQAALATARTLNLTYLPIEQVATIPSRSLLERIALLGDPTEQTYLTIETVLGTVSEPTIRAPQLRTESETIVSSTLRRVRRQAPRDS